MPTFVCERTYDPPVTPEQFAGGSAKLIPCATARGVKWLGSNLAIDGTRGVCTFEADSAESIREASGVAGVRPFTRIYEVNVYKP